MPELPEVQTTVNGINKVARTKIISDVWTDYNSSYHAGKDNIKNPLFFKKFKSKVKGEKILKAERRAKNILIHLSGGNSILIHMKMTGHLMYGKYEFNKKEKKWRAKEKGPLEDPYNQFIHLVFTLSNGKHLVFSDTRKFGKVTLIETSNLENSLHLSHLGPEPLSEDFNLKAFISSLIRKPRGKIKQMLMDQELISGIGNIYSDEMLWLSDIHPLSTVEKIPLNNLEKLYKAMKEVLKKGIDFGGDSMSDYRNIYGEKGEFQTKHNVYQRSKTPCKRAGCKGIIEKTKVGGRTANFCPVHQILFK